MKPALVALALTLIALAAPAAGKSPMRDLPPTREQVIEGEMHLLREQLSQMKSRAYCFALLNQWHLADAELDSAQMTAETLNDYARMVNGSPYADQEIKTARESVAYCKKMHDDYVKELSLPAEAFYNFTFLSYKDGGESRTAVLYNVPDPGLTREKIIANIDAYVADSTKIPCRLILATYRFGKPKPLTTTPLAIGLAPAELVGSSACFVATASGPSTSTTFLLHQGDLLNFLDGPAKGPAVFASDAKNRLALCLDVAWVLTPADGALILTEYSTATLHWQKKITFRDNALIRIDVGDEQKSSPTFIAADNKPIDAATARELATWYAIFHSAGNTRPAIEAHTIADQITLRSDQDNHWIAEFKESIPSQRDPKQIIHAIILSATGEFVGCRITDK